MNKYVPIAQRVGRYLERQGLFERDAENSYLTTDAVSEGPMDQLLGHSITYRIAVGPQAGRKVQTLPACEPDDFADIAGRISGFSLHAGTSHALTIVIACRALKYWIKCQSLDPG